MVGAILTFAVKAAKPRASGSQVDQFKKHKWVMKEMVISWKTVKAVAGTQATLKMKGKLLLVDTGCNGFSGKTSLGKDGAFKMAVSGMTEMACPTPEVLKQEMQMWNLMNKVTRFTITDSLLTLTDKKGENKMILSPYSAPINLPLQETVWTLLHFGEMKADTDSATLANHAQTLQIRDGKASGFGGCNRFGGKVEHASGTIAIKNVFSTKRAGSAAAMEQERLYFSLLGKATKYTVHGNQLTLSTQDGSQSLQFKGSIPEK